MLMKRRSEAVALNCRSKKRIVAFATIAYIGLLLNVPIGCSTGVSESDEEVGQWAVLPEIADNALCAPQPATTLCEWARSTDLFFIGRVESRSLHFAPSVGRNGEVVRTCSGDLEPALEITASVMHRIDGTPPQNAPLTVRVGGAPFKYFRPAGTRGTNQGWIWDADAYLLPGSIFGASVFEVSPGVFGTAYERLFTFDEEGLRFQGASTDCHSSAPWSAEGITENDLLSELDGCSSDAGQLRRSQVMEQFGTYPGVISEPICSNY